MTMVSVYSLMVKNMNNEHRFRLCGRVIVQRHHNARYCRECATNMVGMSAYHYTIPLPPITKKNSQQILTNHRTGKPFIAPSRQYKKYEQAAMWYLTPKPKAPLSGRYRVATVFYMPTRRKVDLTNLMEAAHDTLVAAKILADDNNTIIASVDGSRVLYDKANPRTEIFIEEMPDDEQPV